MELSEIIGVEGVRAPIKATSKKRLLQDLADLAETVYGLPAAAVYKALMDREALGPTGVGRGVAIPHARFAGVHHVVGTLYPPGKAGRFRIDRSAAGGSRLCALRAGVGRSGAPEGAGAESRARCGVTRSAPSCARPLTQQRFTRS